MVMQLLDEMQRQVFRLTLSHTAQQISACKKGGCWEFALEILNECKMWSTPNTISNNAAISACEKGGRWEHALEFLNECKIWSTPDTISYSAAISACEKGGR